MDNELLEQFGTSNQIDPECCLPDACDIKCGECNILPQCLEVEQDLEETKWK